MKQRCRHPGQYLNQVLTDNGQKPEEFARLTKIGRGRLSEIINGKRDITAAIALKLDGLMSAEVWLNLQNDHDLEKLRAKAKAKR